MIGVVVVLVMVGIWQRHRLSRAVTVLGCWMTGHRGLGSICHNCGTQFTRKAL